LRQAYQQVARANKKAYLNNKFWYDRKAKQRKFEVNDLIYLYNPAMKPGLMKVPKTLDWIMQNYKENF